MKGEGEAKGGEGETNDIKSIIAHLSEIKERLDVIDKHLIGVDRTLNEFKPYLTKLTESTSNMDNHINFIHETYSKMKPMLTYVTDRYNSVSETLTGYISSESISKEDTPQIICCNEERNRVTFLQRNCGYIDCGYIVSVLWIISIYYFFSNTLF